MGFFSKIVRAVTKPIKKIIKSPIGDLYAAIVNKQLILLTYYEKDIAKEQIKLLQKEYNISEVIENKKDFELLEKELFEYFHHHRTSFTVPFKVSGTTFQKNVWKVLCDIPYGKTISYKEEAININKASAFRAVANANGKNKIIIIIPCHRVISSSGKLSGYSSGGPKVKEFLINLEKKKILF